MIASIEGVITEILNDSLVINVSGLGFKVYASPLFTNQTELHKRVVLFTYLVVREESLTLYGFESLEEREMFGMLLSVSGVGPRTAMALVSGVSLANITKAVVNEQPELLGGIPGVGKKTAQGIVLHLHGKLSGEPSQSTGKPSETDSDVIAALTSLGYSIVEAQAALQTIPKDTANDLETRIRTVLKYFS